MHIVGHCSAFSKPEKRELLVKLRPFETARARLRRGQPLDGRPGSSSGRATARARDRGLVRHVSGGRIRHGTRVVRWRDDRDPKTCSLDQLV